MEAQLKPLVEAVQSLSNQGFDFSDIATIFSPIIGVLIALLTIRYQAYVSTNLESVDRINELIVNVYTNSRKLAAFKNKYISRLTKNPMERLFQISHQIKHPKKIDFEISKISHFFTENENCPDLIKKTQWNRLDRVVGMIEDYNTLIDVLNFRNEVHYKIITNEKIKDKKETSNLTYNDIVNILGDKEASDYLVSTEDIIEGVDFILYELESFLYHIEYLAKYNIDLELIKKYRTVINVKRSEESFNKITKDSLKVDYVMAAKLLSLDPVILIRRVEHFKRRIPTLSHEFHSMDDCQKNIIEYKFNRSVKDKFRFSFF